MVFWDGDICQMCLHSISQHRSASFLGQNRSASWFGAGGWMRQKASAIILGPLSGGKKNQVRCSPEATPLSSVTLSPAPTIPQQKPLSLLHSTNNQWLLFFPVWPSSQHGCHFSLFLFVHPPHTHTSRYVFIFQMMCLQLPLEILGSHSGFWLYSRVMSMFSLLPGL